MSVGVVGGALVRASHPEPCVAVTTLAVLLAVAQDASVATAATIGAAALAGQLSVGWSNDLIDADRDRVAGRTDKPVATGALSPVVVRIAIRLAVLGAVVGSLALGPRAGLLHLALVALGWAYNLGLKRTVWSWLPYALCFGLMPMVVSLAVSEEPAAWWATTAGALLGVGAHLVNAVPDLEADRLTGVHGLPHRWGARRSLDAATVLLLAGSFVVVLGGGAGPWAATGGVLATVTVIAVAGRLAPTPWPFRAALVVALVDAIALVVRV